MGEFDFYPNTRLQEPRMAFEDTASLITVVRALILGDRPPVSGIAKCSIKNLVAERSAG